ncbi:Metallo-peptidase family M12B Reprolysin-like [Fragilaria crotonensis]|nr:Metallo-peptidase family M12B Reprolysin-like [Fragilaria crotonensis]
MEVILMYCSSIRWVLYTKGAMCSAAGFSTGGTCTATAQNVAIIEGIIALAVAETNKAYELSGIPTKFRLVKIHYDASTTMTMQTRGNPLPNLRNNGDGKLDYVHAMRDQYGADFVSMIVDTSGYCGIGYMPSGPSAADAFTLVHWSCATGYYSFGHEIGHNMGCNHDIRNAGGASGGYNYGYQDPSARFRSILAYQCSSKLSSYSVLLKSKPKLSCGPDYYASHGDPDCEAYHCDPDFCAPRRHRLRSLPLRPDFCAPRRHRLKPTTRPRLLRAHGGPDCEAYHCEPDCCCVRYALPTAAPNAVPTTVADCCAYCGGTDLRANRSATNVPTAVPTTAPATVPLTAAPTTGAPSH